MFTDVYGTVIECNIAIFGSITKYLELAAISVVCCLMFGREVKLGVVQSVRLFVCLFGWRWWGRGSPVSINPLIASHYPLENEHNYGKSPFLLRQFTISTGPFSIAMFMWQRVSRAARQKRAAQEALKKGSGLSFAREARDLCIKLEHKPSEAAVLESDVMGAYWGFRNSVYWKALLSK